MCPSTEEHLIRFLKKNQEVFVWTMTDLHRISPDVITHRLSVNPEMIEPLREVKLPFSLGSYPKRSTKIVKFLVVKTPSAYNIILGRPSLNLFQAITSTFHMKLKSPTPDGVGEVVGDERMARECYVNTLKRSREKLGGTSDQKGKRKITNMKHEIRDALEEPLGKAGDEK
ncbi:UNVERIFIED_CONTAM: hypothetical protein Sangu_2511000 [Sesamum angustifolium]|uniref:Uncharacterized protein n=1 Tax=Sesamum angustifolium TaxID=2727405 RepID=A0AAW2JKU6_9LAMI